MNRRNFLNTLVGGVAVAAAARTWPFRVYSFGSVPTVYPAFDPAIHVVDSYIEGAFTVDPFLVDPATIKQVIVGDNIVYQIREHLNLRKVMEIHKAVGSASERVWAEWRAR